MTSTTGSDDKDQRPEATSVQSMGYVLYNVETGQMYGKFPSLEQACLLVYDISRHGPFHVGLHYTLVDEFTLE